jgi:hypothetical protein
MVNIMNLIGIYSREYLLAYDYQKIKQKLGKAGIPLHLNILYSYENCISTDVISG